MNLTTKRNTRRGFTIIGILLALVIIMVLTGGYFGQLGGSDPSQGTYQVSMERTNEAACFANQNAFRANIMQWQISHAGEPMTIEGMRKAGYSIPHCPEGGEYEFDKDGNIYCKKHNPPERPMGSARKLEDY